MSKKKKEEQVEEVVVTAPEPVKEKPAKKDSWEIKDRIYFLTGNKSPISLTIPGKHTRKHALLYFDSEQGKQREIRYATNMTSPFADEQKGEVTLGHITFRDGVLNVPKEQIALQKLLSLYHPMRGRRYLERKPSVEAATELDQMEWEIDALNAARSMDIDKQEAILRVEIGSKVSSLSSKEVRRDVIRLAKMNPQLFLQLAQDENVELRNFVIKACEENIIYLSQDQRSFHWGTNDRKLMTIPFDENPYSAMASFMKTDEGVEIYKSIEKRLR